MRNYKTGVLVSILALLTLLVPSASAQITPITPGTITVFGEGSVSVPAEEAMIVITIGADANIYYEDPATMQDDPIEPATSTPVDAGNVIDAIVAFGIPETDVTSVDAPFMGEWGSGMGPEPSTILVTMAQPTVEGLSELLDIVQTTAHADGLYVNQFGVLYSVSDCRPLRQAARTAAFENARMEAEDQAAAMNTPLGDVVASRDTLPMNSGYYHASSCNSSTTAIPYSIMYMASQFDPGLPAEVTVWVAVEVSFEIP